MAPRLSAALAAAALVFAACQSSGPPPGARSPSPTASSPDQPPPPFDVARVSVKVRPFASGLAAPVFLTHAGDGSGLLYVLEQAGRIRVLEPSGAVRAQPFLDIRDRVGTGGERGLLGLAFHPDYAGNGRLFVNYTDRAGDTHVAEFHRSGDAVADRGSERLLLKIDQPYANHNGGMIAFGPDGFLYVGMGDGGSQGDPHNNGQSLGTLLGKMLRIDVNGPSPYAVPSNNPFVGRRGARGEIWSYGFRNPWRFSFDPATGDLFIGDVGATSLEEVDVQPGTSRGGENYGWRIMEGTRCAQAECDRAGLTLPVATYPTSAGCAISGGYVYRGSAHPSWVGGYFYSDYCNGDISVLSAADALRGPVSARRVLDTKLAIVSFGRDAAGELYVCDLNGTIARLVE